MALFLFGIGGTGSRVIKALTMLLASGVKINTDKVYPIIIDPDSNNGDLELTVDVLKNYNAINGKLKSDLNQSDLDNEGFFKTQIIPINNKPGCEFRLRIPEIEGKAFKDYIGYNHINDNSPNKDLVSLLYSKDNLDLNMHIGFKGNPNIGSVALNQFDNSNSDFIDVASLFTQNDRIFIISSIFGGTGASGFPILVNNLREAGNLTGRNQIVNGNFLANAKIGAVSVLPYFDLKSGEIDSKDFISKTKAALHYYSDNLISKVNALYYIGYKDSSGTYENNPGANAQRNKAHFVELASAFAVIDFMEQSNPSNVFKEYGVNELENPLTFNQLGRLSKELASEKMTQLKLLTLYFKYRFETTLGKQPWSNRGTIKFNADFLKSQFYKDIQRFNALYDNWLNELAQNEPSFQPFNFSVNESSLLKLVVNHETSRKWMNNFAIYDNYLNKEERNFEGNSEEIKLMDIFYKATQSLIKKEIKL